MVNLKNPETPLNINMKPKIPIPFQKGQSILNQNLHDFGFHVHFRGGSYVLCLHLLHPQGEFHFSRKIHNIS